MQKILDIKIDKPFLSKCLGVKSYTTTEAWMILLELK